jgi:hypothetical protein
MLQGYGDPDAGGLGYGDPEPAAPLLEEGYGDPYAPLLIELLSAGDLPHQGGAPLELGGLIPLHLAPYRAAITRADTGEQVFFYSGRAGQGANLYPLRDRLTCFSPRAPAGVYTLRLFYGPGFTSRLDLVGAITIAPTARLRPRYALARAFPSLYATGARDLSDSPLDDASATPPAPGALEGLIDAAALVIGGLGTAAATIASASAERGAELISVESTLGFSPEGRAWIGGGLYSYTLSAPLALSISPPLSAPIDTGAEVYAHAYPA